MTKTTESICWLNSEIMPLAQARISVMDHAVLYGDGIFEGIRFYNGRAFRLQAHLDRLSDSAAAIGLQLLLDHEALTAAIIDLINAFKEEDGYLRLVVTRGEGPMGLDPSSCKRSNIFIIATSLQMASPEKRLKGIRTIITATRRLPMDGLDPRIKSLNYLNHIQAKMEANYAGVDEGILLNASGHVAEATAANVFIVKNDVLATPPVSDGALVGVTRGVIIELAQQLNLKWREQTLAPYDLYTADECFLTGTGAELIPVREIDARRLKHCPGEFYTCLQQKFYALIQQETEV